MPEKSFTRSAEMPFVEHLRELRTRILRSLVGVIVGAIIGYIFYDSYVHLLTEPFGQTLKMRVVVEGFLMQIKIAFYAGIILSFPLHVYNVTAFVLPALVAKERRVLAVFLCGSLVLGLIGIYMAYFQILPYSVQFLKQYQPPGTEYELFFRDNIQLVCQLVIAFIVLFQIPLVMLLLMWFNVVTPATFMRIGRYFIILIFILSAILTPPDIISQIGLAIPLIILYYLAILLAKLFHLGSVET